MHDLKSFCWYNEYNSRGLNNRKVLVYASKKSPSESWRAVDQARRVQFWGSN